ncbi:MAG: hypothetical protein R3A46_07580 [Thermomicrobiales bacterium]
MQGPERKKNGAPAKAMIVEGLRKSYGQIDAGSEIDCSVAGGEIFGLLGHNVAGKTTTIRVLTGGEEGIEAIMLIASHPDITVARALLGVIYIAVSVPILLMAGQFNAWAGAYLLPVIAPAFVWYPASGRRRSDSVLPSCRSGDSADGQRGERRAAVLESSSLARHPGPGSPGTDSSDSVSPARTHSEP